MAKRNFIIDSIVVNTLRGQDATGIAMLPAAPGFTPEVYKKALSGWDFAQLATTRKLLNRIEGTSGVIVHNRLATKGDLSDTGAHPFVRDHITLVHNGVVDNFYQLKDTLFDGTVDSDAIAHRLSIQEPTQVLPDISGAYSLVWWDSRDGSLHFARNERRPMFFMYTKGKTHLLFASEYQMIWAIASRHGLQLEKDAFETSEHHHYVFSDPAKPEVFVKTPFPPSQRRAGHARNNTRGTVLIGSQNTNRTEQVGGSQTTLLTDTTISKATTSGNSITARALASALKGYIKESRIPKLMNLALGFGGVPLGSPILLIPKKFVPYTNSKNKREVRGVLHATHPRTLAPVRICNVLESAASVIINDDYISAKVVNFQKEDNQHVFVATAYTSIQKANEDRVTMDASKEDNVIDMVRNYVKGPNGVLISPERFKELTKLDCANCFNPVNTNDAEKIRWLHMFTPIQFLCPECATDKQIAAIFPEDKSQYAH